MKVRLKTQILKATQWFQIGDHPEVRRPSLINPKECPYCHKSLNEHGFINIYGYSEKVCPGDWILELEPNRFHVLKDDIFKDIYEEVENN